MTKPPAGRLRPFRLTEVPLELRLAAARRLARNDARLPDDAVDPRDRLFATLAGGVVGREFDALRRVAESPSPRVYWISETAWENAVGSPSFE